MTAPESADRECRDWTDEYLLQQFSVGPDGFADAQKYGAIRAEVVRRGLPSILPPRAAAGPSRPYLSRLWRGEIPLGATYWGWFVAAANILAAVVHKLEGLGLAAARGLYGDRGSLVDMAVVILVLAYAGYLGFALVVVWRSAAQYRGAPMWAALARIVVVLNVFGLIVLLGVMV